MKRLEFCAALMFVLASQTSAKSPVPAAKPVATAPASSRAKAAPAHARPAPAAPEVFKEYCFECHGTDKPKADLSIERLAGDPSPVSIGAKWQDWERVAEMLESGKMPPKEATLFPTDNERAGATSWIRTSLKAYEDKYAGDPGHVTVRRLTSAEYAYAVRDLTGIDIKVGIDASSDSVGGEGFANFGDVQFVQDANIERYLEAAKIVADRAVIGAGPLDFYSDTGKTGLELSALNRIDELYAAKGFRTPAGGGPCAAGAGPRMITRGFRQMLGADRNAVVRLMISDRLEGAGARDAMQRVLMGDPASAGYKNFRAGVAEYVSLLPPNSHGEANPADKDPVPAPFDNTYNSPEHDAFVLKVKYQRNDGFFTQNLVDGEDRARLNQAWNDLFGSWPYHDAYLQMLADHYDLKLQSRRISDLTPAQIAAMPEAARPYLTSLRKHYDEVMKAQALAEPGHIGDALTVASRAWRRPLTPIEKANLRASTNRRGW
jgi:mono/diheme cytochrome c family protein